MRDFILIDFDTVICEGAQREGDEIIGQPNPGVLDALHVLCVHRLFPVGIVSKFTLQNKGSALLKEWFKRFGFDPAAIEWMFYVALPPHALYISRLAYDPAPAARAVAGTPMIPPMAMIDALTVLRRVPVYTEPNAEPPPLPTTDTFGSTV